MLQLMTARYCEKSQSWLAINRISNNAGAVNPFFPHFCMHSEKSAISLSLKVLLSQPKGSLAIRFRSGPRSDPCISSILNCDHDYYFELLREEEWNAQAISRCSTAHHGDFRAVPRTNRIS